MEKYLNYPNIPSKITYIGDKSNRYGVGLCRQEIQAPSGYVKRNVIQEVCVPPSFFREHKGHHPG